MAWTPSQAPAEPEGAAEQVVVDEAVLTPLSRGRLRTAAGAPGPDLWMTGAVHDREGALVPASQRVWDDDPRAPVAVDPPQVEVPRRARRLPGTWRYAGHWTQHFGHFLLEVLTNLWGEPTAVDGLVAHRSYRGGQPAHGAAGPTEATLHPWQADLLALAGYPVPVRVVRQRPVVVERLVVPSRPVVLKRWAAPEAVAVWRRVAEAVGRRGDDRLVFLSRTRFHALEHDERGRVRSDAAWDSTLDAAFAAAGFVVLHPEELTIPEQVAAVRGARVLAGAAGSALHLSAFADPGTHVLEVGDRRSPARALPTQLMVDAACGHLTRFVPAGDRAALDAALADLPVRS